MATFLQLVNDLERESGTIYQGSRLATVVGAPGRQEKMVEWIREAWRLIQTARSDWPWLRSEFQSGAVASGTARYLPTALGITDLSDWQRSYALTIYRTSLGRADECALRWLAYDEWRERWDRRTHNGNRPLDAAIDRKGRLCLGPTPDAAYTVRGDYRRTAQILAADTDVPLCPAEHHHLIVWRAMVLLGEHDEAAFVIQTANSKVMAGMRALVDDSMEAVSL